MVDSSNNKWHRGTRLLVSIVVIQRLNKTIASGFAEKGKRSQSERDENTKRRSNISPVSYVRLKVTNLVLYVNCASFLGRCTVRSTCRVQVPFYSTGESSSKFVFVPSSIKTQKYYIRFTQINIKIANFFLVSICT